MAEMTQQTPLVIEVQSITALTEAEKTTIRRAIVRGHGRNIELKEKSTDTATKVLTYTTFTEEGEVVELSAYSTGGMTIETVDCGEITADDLKDEIFD